MKIQLYSIFLTEALYGHHEADLVWNKVDNSISKINSKNRNRYVLEKIVPKTLKITIPHVKSSVHLV